MDSAFPSEASSQTIDELANSLSEGHTQVLKPTRQGKTNKNESAVEKAPKTVWATDVVKTLLDKRCDDFAASFELNRSAAQLSILWGKIALAINVEHEKATGNEVKVVYPPNWDDAVAALGNKTGLGHHDYAFGANYKSRDSDDSSNDNLDILPQSNRQAIIEAELSRQRAKRTKKLDIGQSLVALGQSLAERMKGLRTPAPSDNNQVQETSKLIAQIASRC
ncbi:hypothetical protein AC1031_001984 [Aphanomyces cochlioides]|nr:hypothetical protein AC1031_001984 [Aphanomyces cochlioides]